MGLGCLSPVPALLLGFQNHVTALTVSSQAG